MRRLRRSLACGALALAALSSAPDARAQDARVLSASVSADPSSYRGPCGTGVRVSLTGKILTSGTVAGIKAQFRFGNGTLGPVLVAARREGNYVVRDSFVRSASWNETVVLVVLAPNPIESPPITVTGACDAVAQRPAATNRPAPPLPPGTERHEARFRVTATGFRVERQTIESVLETNGVGDEAKLVCFGGEYVLGGGYTALPTVRTLTYGDVDGTRDFSRVQAGSGNGRSRGGLVTGDEVPGPAAGGVAPSRRTSDAKFPIVLWEGVLRDGPGVPNNLVMLLPTLWEVDHAPQNDLMPEFGPWAAAFLAQYGRSTMTDLVAWGGTQWGHVPLLGNGMFSNRFQAFREGEFSRPVGINGAFATGPLERRERPYQTEVYFVPRPLRLTYAVAWSAVQVGGSDRYLQPGPGRIELQFNEPDEWAGRYWLHLRIELVPR